MDHSLDASLRNNLKEPFEFLNGGFTPCKVIQDSLGFWNARCGFGIPCRWNLDYGFQMNERPQTNMPEKEDLISKKIPSRHIAICKADRTT